MNVPLIQCQATQVQGLTFDVFLALFRPHVCQHARGRMEMGRKYILTPAVFDAVRRLATCCSSLHLNCYTGKALRSESCKQKIEADIYARAPANI